MLVWCSFSKILCYIYARCKGTHTFQKVQILSRHSTEYFPKIPGDHQDVFWQSFCSAVVGTLPCRSFLPSLFLMVESWTLTLTEASEACSSFDVVVESLVTCWMSNEAWCLAFGDLLIFWFAPPCSNKGVCPPRFNRDFFPLNNKNFHLKTAFCVYLCYFCFDDLKVWQNKKSRRGPTLFHTTNMYNTLS